MPDYLHDLRFGVNIVPRAQQAEEVVELSRQAERLGFDLVTFQDHPYQPAFLDAWTLASFVAASTTSVHVALNVTNLPLRLPAVIARSVASLDILSGGRTELGIGAGAFWDAIAANGGRRLRPGQAVDALDEALTVIETLWDRDARRTVTRLDGTYYHVNGAKPGPFPIHPVGVWIGAYKPRMLRLTGRRGTGWWPSLGYLELDQIAASNARIDEAAQDAGRESTAIRRLLNLNGSFGPSRGRFLEGPPEQWVEQLAELTLTHGMSSYLISGDNPRHIQLFAERVIPELRALVEDERRRTQAV